MFPLTIDQLRKDVADKKIDTVVVAMCDMQGRRVGKRLDAKYFLSDVLKHGTEGCNYLLAVDVDMNTVPGYAMSSWEKGYSDLAMIPDTNTLRYIPWQDGAALRTFAYEGSAHKSAIAKTAELNWYSEELFARFGVREIFGTLNGVDFT